MKAQDQRQPATFSSTRQDGVEKGVLGVPGLWWQLWLSLKVRTTPARVEPGLPASRRFLTSDIQCRGNGDAQGNTHTNGRGNGRRGSDGGHISIIRVLLPPANYKPQRNIYNGNDEHRQMEEILETYKKERKLVCMCVSFLSVFLLLIRSF